MNRLPFPGRPATSLRLVKCFPTACDLSSPRGNQPLGRLEKRSLQHTDCLRDAPLTAGLQTGKLRSGLSGQAKMTLGGHRWAWVGVGGTESPLGQKTGG